MTRSGWLVIFVVALAAVLAAVQVVTRAAAMPPPDALTYFDVADQIQRVGYAHALPLHWPPLYPLALVAMRSLVHAGRAAELVETARLDAVFLVSLCAVVALAFRSIAILCWPDDAATRFAWLSCACGLALFFAFGLLRVGFRMPDALVTCFAVAGVWAWCRAAGRGLVPRWCLLAGLLSGLAFLARSNLLHWSVLVGAVACSLAPGVSLRRRVWAYLAFAVGLLAFVGPQAYVLSRDRGRFVFGETGKLVFADTYGAVWPGGVPSWPLRPDAGDARIFTERHVVHYPGFYDPGREYDDATVPFRWSLAGWGVLRSLNACLFGYSSGSFALLWPLLWALWPVALAAIEPRAGPRPRLRSKGGEIVVRRRIAALLMLAGAAGVGMHLLSACYGYYLPPYLILLLTGAYVIVLEPQADHAADAMRRRMACVMAGGFILAAVMVTGQSTRPTDVRHRRSDLEQAWAMASRLRALPPGPDGLRRIAVVGSWLGLYGVRLSDSQIAGDVQDAAILQDPARTARAIATFRRYGVVALLTRRDALPLQAAGSWRTVGDGAWAMLDLRAQNGGAP